MRFELNGKECELRFRYHIVRGQDTTTCLFLHEGVEINRGLAVRHPSDRSNRIIGRKVALADALKSQPREYRTLVWSAFFAASPRHKR